MLRWIGILRSKTDWKYSIQSAKYLTKSSHLTSDCLLLTPIRYGRFPEQRFRKVASIWCQRSHWWMPFRFDFWIEIHVFQCSQTLCLVVDHYQMARLSDAVCCFLDSCVSRPEPRSVKKTKWWPSSNSTIGKYFCMKISTYCVNALTQICSAAISTGPFADSRQYTDFDMIPCIMVELEIIVLSWSCNFSLNVAYTIAGKSWALENPRKIPRWSMKFDDRWWWWVQHPHSFLTHFV